MEQVNFNNYRELNNASVSHSQGVNWDNSTNIMYSDLIWSSPPPSSNLSCITSGVDPKYNPLTDNGKYHTIPKSFLSNAYISSEEDDEEDSDDNDLSSQSTDNSTVNDNNDSANTIVSMNNISYQNTLQQMKDSSTDQIGKAKLASLSSKTNNINFNSGNSDTNSITDFHKNTTDNNQSMSMTMDKIILNDHSTATIAINGIAIQKKKSLKHLQHHHQIHSVKIQSEQYHHYNHHSALSFSQKQQHRKSFSEYMINFKKKKEKTSWFSTIFHRDVKEINKRNSLHIEPFMITATTTIPLNNNNKKFFSFLSIPPLSKKSTSSSTSSKKKKERKNSKDNLSLETEPPIFEIDYVENKRLPIQLERGIYRLSHTKLMDLQRPLHQQVTISNLMFWYLSLTNPDIKRLKPKSLSSADNHYTEDIRYIHVTRPKKTIPSRISSPPPSFKNNLNKLNNSPISSLR